MTIIDRAENLDESLGRLAIFSVQEKLAAAP